MKKEMRDYKYPQGVAPSAKVEGGMDDKKMNKTKSKIKAKSSTDMFGVPVFGKTKKMNKTKSAFQK